MKTTHITLLLITIALTRGKAFAQPMHIPTPDEIPPGYVQIDGDVIAHAEDVIDDGFGPRTVFNPGTVWPNNRIPIEYDANVSAANQTLFASVLAQWTAVCSVTFPARSGEAAYLHVMGDSSICGYDFSTSAGYTGGRVEIHVSTQGAPNCVPPAGSPPNGWNLFQLVHEVGHVMGFQHEQGRDDRETGGYVQIETANIQGGQASQFAIYNPQRHYGPYDFDSIMHYSACAFSSCARPLQPNCPFDPACRTITVLAPFGINWQANIGLQDNVSLMDAKLASFMYCPSNWRFLDPGQTNSAHLGTVQDQYTSLSEALQNTPAGGTIQIAPGVIHAGPVPRVINQSVTLRAALWDAQLDPSTGNLVASTTGYTILAQ